MYLRAGTSLQVAVDLSRAGTIEWDNACAIPADMGLGYLRAGTPLHLIAACPQECTWESELEAPACLLT